MILVHLSDQFRDVIGLQKKNPVSIGEQALWSYYYTLRGSYFFLTNVINYFLLYNKNIRFDFAD